MTANQLRPPGYSFCIITAGQRRAKLLNAIASINSQRLTTFEIIIAGSAWTSQLWHYVPMQQVAAEGRTSTLRNTAAERSRFDRLVFMDDDIILADGWAQRVEDFPHAWDLLQTRLLNLDGTRYWDSATIGGPRGHSLLDYGETEPNRYFTGGLIVTRAKVWTATPWDETLGFRQSEDVAFSRAVLGKGFRTQFCWDAIAVHNDLRYTQIGRRVFMRRPESATNWSEDRFRTCTVEDLVEQSIRDLSEGKITSAADRLRYALHKAPRFESASRLFAQLERRHGGKTDQGIWQPQPITRGCKEFPSRWLRHPPPRSRAPASGPTELSTHAPAPASQHLARANHADLPSQQTRQEGSRE